MHPRNPYQPIKNTDESRSNLITFIVIGAAFVYLAVHVISWAQRDFQVVG